MIASTKDPTVGTTARSSRPTLGVVGSTLLATIGLLTQPAGPCLAAPTSPTRLQRSPQRTVDIQVWSDDRIEPTSPHLPVGISDWLWVRVKYSDQNAPEHHRYSGRESPMQWKVLPASDGRPPVVSIDEEGRVTTLAPGRAQIEVRYMGQIASTILTVFEREPTLLELSPVYTTIELGSELQFAAQAQFDGPREWDRTQAVSWTATQVGSQTHVVSIDEGGMAHALREGVAEITATLSGKSTSTRVMVVARSRLSPQRAGQLTPPAVYRTCRARLRQLWLPKLRELAAVELREQASAIQLSGESARRSASLGLRVGDRGGPGIEIIWSPDQCEGPTAWWSSTFDWRTPSTPLEQLLTFAGNDCVSYPLR